MKKQQIIDGLHALVAAGEDDLGKLKSELEHIGSEVASHLHDAAQALARHELGEPPKTPPAPDEHAAG